MKRAKTPERLAANASKLHKHIGSLLTSDLFRHWEIRQEYPVNQVNPSFKSGREKFDWVILSLNVVIEIHGEQHSRPICFGGVEIDTAKRNFRKRIEADWTKEEAARDAGWAYVVVWHHEKKITAEELHLKISEAIDGMTAAKDQAPAKPKAKIPHPKEYKWPKGKKIPGRKFNGEPIR